MGLEAQAKLTGTGVRSRPWFRTAGLVAVLTLAYAAGFLTARVVGGPFAALGSAPWAWVQGPHRGSDGAPRADGAPPEDLGEQFQVFWEAWNFVEREHYLQPVNRTRLIQGAIKGMIGALNDQYGAYLDPAQTRLEKANLDGVIEGIGASVEIKDRRYVILAPIEDSPAARAGLRTGDILLRVDGKDVGTLTLAETIALLRGPAGTKIKLSVLKPDDPEGQPVEIEITRARIELESVSYRLAADGVGYVRIRVFGPQTLTQLTRSLRDLRGRRVRGIILDLRDNPGGYLSSAVDVASQFLREGSVVVYEEQNGQRRQSLARPGGLATDLAVVVLVNRGTASGSEIVAGALRDHNRAVLIGETTFGKGSVQLPRELSDGSSVRVTVASWLTPAGKLIQGQGLTPSIEAKPSPEDEKARRDVALERALEWFGVPTTSVATTG